MTCLDTQCIGIIFQFSIDTGLLPSHLAHLVGAKTRHENVNREGQPRGTGGGKSVGSFTLNSESWLAKLKDYIHKVSVIM